MTQLDHRGLHPSAGCQPCTEYLAARMPVLEPHIETKALREHRSKRVVLWAYMFRVHHRHQEGLTLAAGSYLPTVVDEVTTARAMALAAGITAGAR